MGALIRAVVIGQSHTVCMSRAAAVYPDLACGISIFRLAGKLAVPGDGSVSLQEAAGIARNLPTGTPTFLSVAGGIHNVIGLVRHDQDFDFIFQPHTELEDLDETKVIPRRAMADTMDYHVAKTSKFLGIKKAASGPVFLISAPPPKGQNEFLLKKFAKARKEYHGKIVVDVGVNTPRLRKKFWDLECERAKHWAQTCGIGYLDAPPEAMEDDGFLQPQYYEDATHANMEYGALVLKQISVILENQAGTSSHG